MALETVNIVIDENWQEVVPAATTKIIVESFDNDAFQFAYGAAAPASATFKGHSAKKGEVITCNKAGGDQLYVKANDGNNTIAAAVSYE